MANVAKLVEIIFGANPTQDDLRAIIERLNERLPKPIVGAPIESEPAEKVAKSKAKNKEG